MKPETLQLLMDTLLKLVMFFSTLIAIIVALKDYHRRKIEEAREKSVGAEAVSCLKKEISMMKDQIDKGQMNAENFKMVLERLTEDYNFLMKKMFDFFKPPK